MSEEEELIPLEGAEDTLPLAEEKPRPVASKIQAFGSTSVVRQASAKFQRQPSMTGAGAIRCRLFNSKLSVSAMDHMVTSINEWLEANNLEVKHVNQVIGDMEGKSNREPNVIVTVWY